MAVPPLDLSLTTRTQPSSPSCPGWPMLETRAGSSAKPRSPHVVHHPPHLARVQSSSALILQAPQACHARDSTPAGIGDDPAHFEDVSLDLRPADAPPPQYTASPSPRRPQPWPPASPPSLSPSLSPSSPRHARSFSRSLTHKLSTAWRAPIPDDFRSRSRQGSPQRSPTREERSDLMPTLTGDANGEINADLKSSAVGGGIGTWFKGSSAPVSLGVAVPDLTDMASAPPPPQAATLRKPSPASVSRFSLFGSKPAQEQLSSPRDGSTDECLTLDISTALMPTGLRDPKSSQAFHELQAKADALLHKMQNAYKSRTLQLQEASNEREALQEEKEEAETRSRHLKMQLEQMAIRLADQETTTQEIARELALERQRRHEEALARKRSVALVTQPRSRRPRANGVVESSPTTSVSDSGFDSDDADESSADSIFSRAQGTTSPTGTLLSSTTRTTSPEPDQQWSAMSDLARPPPPHRASTFDKVLKVISKKRENEVEAVPCPRCQGSHGSGSSWDLRQENMELKERVAALEGAVEGCLGTLGGSSAF